MGIGPQDIGQREPWAQRDRGIDIADRGIGILDQQVIQTTGKVVNAARIVHTQQTIIILNIGEVALNFLLS